MFGFGRDRGVYSVSVGDRVRDENLLLYCVPKFIDEEPNAARLGTEPLSRESSARERCLLRFVADQ